MTSVDLPPPETPVTQVKRPSGISAVDVLEIVAARADDARARAPVAACGASARDRPLSPVRYWPVSECGIGHDLARRPLRDDLAAVDAGARADIDDVVGGEDRVLVVLDDDDACCRDRAAAAACRAGGHCRADAGRSTARRARRARRSAPSRSATRAGCAGSRRPTACPSRATSVR